MDESYAPPDGAQTDDTTRNDTARDETIRDDSTRSDTIPGGLASGVKDSHNQLAGTENTADAKEDERSPYGEPGMAPGDPGDQSRTAQFDSGSTSGAQQADAASSGPAATRWVPPVERLDRFGVRSQVQAERVARYVSTRPIRHQPLSADPFDQTRIILSTVGLRLEFGTSDADALLALRVRNDGWTQPNFDNYYAQARLTFELYDPLTGGVVARSRYDAPPVFSRISEEDAMLNSVRRALATIPGGSAAAVEELVATAASAARRRGIAYRVELPAEDEDSGELIRVLHALGDWDGYLLRALMIPSQLQEALDELFTFGPYTVIFDISRRKVEIRRRA